MKVVSLEIPNLKDVPASLRRLADQMETGVTEKSSHVIVVSETPSGEIILYGYGEVGHTAYEVGMLQMAVLKLASDSGE